MVTAALRGPGACPAPRHPPRGEVKRAVGEAFARLDYAEYGGAPLLGTNAPVLIGHGRSSPHAIMNMIRAASAPHGIQEQGNF